MLVYTIRKNDLYKSGIEPTRKILDRSSEKNNVDYARVFAKILMELVTNTGNIN